MEISLNIAMRKSQAAACRIAGNQPDLVIETAGTALSLAAMTMCLHLLPSSEAMRNLIVPAHRF
jgi:hypothetical protein